MKIALVIDNAGNLNEQDLRVINPAKVVPISFVVNGEEYYENVNMSYTDFYGFLTNNSVSVSTSQPSIETVKEAWREVLKDYDQIVYIILSSGLSAACNNATIASHEAEFEGRVFVVNNQRVSYMNKMSIYEARYMINQGKSAEEIKEYLEKTGGECAAFIAVSTLKFLKKGGRITPAAAAIGTLLNIKPILQVRSGKLDAYAKVMSMKAARIKMIQAVIKEIEERFPEELKAGQVLLGMAHTNPDLSSQELEEFKAQVLAEIPNLKLFAFDPLPHFIACHTGPNALAVGYVLDRMGAYSELVK